MGIAELEKPPGVWCPNRKGDTGCSIYGSHPHSCQVFACQWLIEPAIPAKFRPDRTKVVLTWDDAASHFVANCDPNNPLAWKRAPTYQLLKEQARRNLSTGVTVMAKAGKRHWVITPTEDIDIGEIGENTPLHIRRFPDGKTQVTVLPAPAEDIDEHLAKLRAGDASPQ
jgi:hypothetical protein